jgi:hypothetical protein
MCGVVIFGGGKVKGTEGICIIGIENARKSSNRGVQVKCTRSRERLWKMNLKLAVEV